MSVPEVRAVPVDQKTGRPLELALKVRRVRTREGAEKYDLPIGAVITPDLLPSFREGQVPALFVDQDARDDEEFSEAYEAHGRAVAAALYARLSPEARRTLIADRANDEFFDEVNDYHREGVGPLDHGATWTKDEYGTWALNPYFSADELDADPEPSYEEWLRGDDPRLVDELGQLGVEGAESFVWNWSTGWHDTAMDEFRTFAIFEAADQEFAPARARRMLNREDVGLSMNPEYVERYWAHVDTLVPAYRELLRAMHADTQAWFAERGLTEVRVARGLRFSENAVPTWARVLERNGESQAPSHGLSSWTVDPAIADLFASGKSPGPSPERWGDYQAGDVGVVIEATVPVEDVLSIPHTGFGAMDQYEAVVIARHQRVTGRVYRDDDDELPPSGYVEGPPAAAEVPAPPSETPLPSGTFRAYHWTAAVNADHVRQHGLTMSTAKGSGYGEPDALWFNGANPEAWGQLTDDGKVMVEVALPDDVYVANGGPQGDFALIEDVPPGSVLAVHEAWHGRYRYFRDNDMVDEVKAGDFDHLLDDPTYAPAIEKIKGHVEEDLPPSNEPEASLTAAEMYKLVDKESAHRIRKKKAAVKFYAQRKDGLDVDTAQLKAEEYELEALRAAVTTQSDGEVKPAVAPAATPAGADLYPLKVSERVRGWLERRDVSTSDPDLWAKLNEEDAQYTTAEASQLRELLHQMCDEAGTKDLEEDYQARGDWAAANHFLKNVVSAVPLPARKQTVEPQGPRELTFDADRLEKLDVELERLNKIAAKLGVPPLTYEVIARSTRKEKVGWNDLYVKDADDVVEIETVTVRLEGSSPKLPGGWQYLGTIEYLKGAPGADGGALVHGKDKRLAVFREKDPDCDYCHLARDRKKTMILVNEENELSQVGSSCLKDFLGYHGDPEKVTQFADSLEKSLEELEDDDGPTYARPSMDVPSTAFLDVSAAMVRAFGWVSKSAAQYEKNAIPTAARVGDRFFPPKRDKYNNDYLDALMAVKVEPADQAKARKAVAWLKEQSSDDNYLGNLKAILGGSHVSAKHFGLAASVIGAYDRAMGKEVERTKAKEAAKLSDHVGAVGKRDTFTATVAAIKTINTDYGESRLVKLVDEDGNALKTFASGAWAWDIEVGDHLTFKGTVKSHDEWQGAKETNLTRVGTVVNHTVLEAEATREALFAELRDAVGVDPDDFKAPHVIEPGVAAGGRYVPESWGVLNDEDEQSQEVLASKEDPRLLTHRVIKAIRQVVPDTDLDSVVIAAPSGYGADRLAPLRRDVAERLLADDLGDVIAEAFDAPNYRQLTPQERSASVQGRFSVKDPVAVAGKHVVVIDDVWATGAQLRAVRQALLDAGAAMVTLAVAAHALPPRSSSPAYGEKVLTRRVRTVEGARRFGLPIGAPIVGGAPDTTPRHLAAARAEVEEREPLVHLQVAMRDWLHWQPAKEIRMSAGELTGTYDDVLSPQLYDDADESGFAEEMRLYGPPPQADFDADTEADAAYAYTAYEHEARALLEALATAAPHDAELWRHVNVPLDRQHAFDEALEKGYVDLPLEAVGDSEDFVFRFNHTAVPEDPEHSPEPPGEDDYDEGWYADDPTSVPPPSEAELELQRVQEEFHVPVLFRILPGARALTGDGMSSEGGRGHTAWQEFITGGRFEVVSDTAEPYGASSGSRRIVTLRQTHTLHPGGEVRPSVSLTPLEEFERLGLVLPRLYGVDQRLIDFVEERSLSDPRLVQRIDAAVKGARFAKYSRLPFIRALGHVMGVTNFEWADPWEYEQKRRDLFDPLPVQEVPLDKLVYTQPNVNRESVLAKVNRGGDKRREGYAVLGDDGLYYLLDGHHGVVADALLGRHQVSLRVIEEAELERQQRELYAAQREARLAGAGAKARNTTSDVDFRGQVYAWALDIMRTLVEGGLEVKEMKARVRSAAGTAKYNLPIGALIRAGVPRADRRTSARAQLLDSTPVEHDPRVHGAERWWNQNDVEPIRAAAMSELRHGEYDPDDFHASIGHTLLRVIEAAGPTDRVLWRGSRQDPRKFKPGKRTQLPLSAFSESETSARAYVNGARGRTTVFQLLPGAYGADVAEIMRDPFQKEWLALGFFDVVSVEDDVVTLSAVADETKARVRTSEGSEKFDLPIGAVIVIDKRTTQGQTKGNFRHPKTGHAMGKTEIGDTFEQLFKAKMTKGMNKKFGCCLKLITGAGDGTARNTPLDFSVGTRGGEVKTLSALTKNQKTAIKKEEIGRKLDACEAKGLEPLLCVQVVDQTAGKVRVYTYESFASKAVTAMELVGEYSFGPEDFEKAQRAAGHWDKAEERAKKQEAKTAKVGDEYDPPDEEGGVLEAGDTVIELNDDGVPMIYTLAEREEKAIRRVRTTEGARAYGQPIGSIITPDVFDAPTLADLSTWDLSTWKERAAARDSGEPWYVRLAEAARAYDGERPALYRGVGATSFVEGEVVDLPLSDWAPNPDFADGYDEGTLLRLPEGVDQLPSAEVDPDDFYRHLAGGRFRVAKVSTVGSRSVVDLEPVDDELPPMAGELAPPPPAPPGAKTYKHPQGATIYVLPDGSLEAWDKYGKKKSTSATPEKLQAGHGGWYLVYENEDDVEEEEVVALHGVEVPPGFLPAGAFQNGVKFKHPEYVVSALTVDSATMDDNEYGQVHVITEEGFEFWADPDEAFELWVEPEEIEGLEIDDVEPKQTPGAVTFGEPPPGSLTYVHPQGATIYVLPDGTMYAFTKEGKKKETSATPAKLAAGHGGWALVTTEASAEIVDDHEVGSAGGGEVEKPSAPPPEKFKHEKPMKFVPGDLKDVNKYIEDGDIWFQQKLDGIRGQLVISPNQKPWFRSASGGKLVSDTAAKTTNPLLTKLPTAGEGTAYSIDGEILNGKMYVFDMVVEGHEKMAYEDRFAMAEAWTRHLHAAGITEVVAVPTARTPGEKRRLYESLLEGGGEGVMAKRRDAGYAPDKRVTHSVKLKFTSTADVVVTAKDTGGHKNYELAMMGTDGKLVPMGSTSAQGKEEANVGDVIEVRYLSYAGPGSHLVQPTMLRKRPEKTPEEATLDQLRTTNKEVVDASVMQEKGVRKVRTPAGVRVFGQPLGSIIVADFPDVEETTRSALDVRALALEDLDGTPELGKGKVDGRFAKSTVHSTADLHPDVEDEDDQSVRVRLSAAFRKGRSKRMTVWVDELYATQARLSRDAVRRTVEGFFPGDKTHRKGYRLQVVKENGEYYVTDGHHRLEAAILLGEESLEADVVDTDKKNIELALQLAKAKGPAVAKALLAKAAEVEPEVSELMQAAIGVAGGRLELFDKRLKTEGAIVERISRNMASAAARGLEANAEKAGQGVPDVLRYTAVFEEDDYVVGAIDMMKMLNGLGYKSHVGGWGNSWSPGGTYKGLNLRLIPPDSDQVFELQFHTTASLTAKRENHKTYVQWRNLPPSDPQKKTLGKEMADRAKAVATPKGAVGVNWRGHTWKDTLGWDGT